MSTDGVIKKIRALRAKATNAASTEAEVEAAAAAITKLMMKHDIDESQLRGKPQSMGVHASTDAMKHDRDEILNRCWFGVQTLTETKMYCEPNTKGASFHFVGDEADVEMGVYLTEIILTYGQRAWLAHRLDILEKGTKRQKTSRLDFYSAYGDRMHQRLMQLAEERQSVRSKAVGTAIVVRKTDIIKAKMKEMGVALRKSRKKTRTVYDHNAASAGRSAADNVNLNRPFGGGVKERIE